MEEGFLAALRVAEWIEGYLEKSIRLDVKISTGRPRNLRQAVSLKEVLPKKRELRSSKSLETCYFPFRNDAPFSPPFQGATKPYQLVL